MKVSKEDLINAKVTIVVDENELGGYSITQPYIQGARNTENRWCIKRPVYVNVKTHPHGKDKAYLMTSVKVYSNGDFKLATMPLHRLIYIYFNGNFPEGYDIAYLDDDPFNCSIDNLKAMPHVDNIRQRKVAGNQYKNSKTV